MTPTDNSAEFHQCSPVTDDGFCEWINPKKRGYLMKCCDCGLVHEIEFDVAFFTGKDDPHAKVVESEQFGVLFRVRRVE